MTVASSGQGPKGCRILSSGPLIKGRTPRTQSSRFLSSLHPCSISRMIPGLRTVKYTCFYGPDPLSISLTLFSISPHSSLPILTLTHSSVLSFYLNLIVTSYLSPNPHGLFFTTAPNKCMQKEEAWLVSTIFLHIDHTDILLQVGSRTHNVQPQVTQRRVPYKGLPFCLTPIESTFPLS